MNFKRFLSVSLLTATCVISFSSVDAQSLRRDSGPAEYPPASFKGSQYVDSKGCVYIRAGVDGNTSWVPRVSRARKVVCGMSPSLGAGAGTTTAAAKPAAPVQIGVNTVDPKSPPSMAQVAEVPRVRTTAPARTSVASILAPKPVRTVASKPVVRRQASNAPQVQRVNIPQPSGVARPTMQARLPQVRQAAPQPTTTTRRTVAAAPRRVTVQSRTAGTQTCQGASAVSQRYIGGRGTAVRCGPQTQSPYLQAGQVASGKVRTANGQMVDIASVNPNAVVVPRHVYEQQQNARITTPVPQGYRQAWDDDRLNTRRTYQTLGGKAQMDVIWSKTVPRRLISVSTGRDVSRAFPGLRYPYTSMAQQNAALSQQGVGTRRVVVSSKGQAAPRRQVAAVAPQKQVRVSTQSPAPRKPAAAAGHRFVQVGTFGVANNAQRTAARLQQMGLPVRIGKFVRGGKEMRIVLAGPFQSSAHTGGALNALRNAGFRDAFARN